MATSQYAISLLGGLDASIKRVFTDIFQQLIPNWRFGPVSHQAKSENFQAYYVTSTTSSTANDEFSVVHGMGRTPYILVPVLPLDQVNAKTVRLQVSKAADNNRVYLKSPEASAVVYFLLE